MAENKVVNPLFRVNAKPAPTSSSSPSISFSKKTTRKNRSSKSTKDKSGKDADPSVRIPLPRSHSHGAISKKDRDSIRRDELTVKNPIFRPDTMVLGEKPGASHESRHTPKERAVKHKKNRRSSLGQEQLQRPHHQHKPVRTASSTPVVDKKDLSFPGRSVSQPHMQVNVGNTSPESRRARKRKNYRATPPLSRVPPSKSDPLGTARNIDPTHYLSKVENPIYLSRMQLTEALMTRKQRLLQAICDSVSSEECEDIAKALYHTFNTTEAEMLNLVHWCIKKEVSAAVKANNVYGLFRGTSIQTKLVSMYCRIEGKNYLRALLKPLVEEVMKEDFSLEVDPNRLDESENLGINQARLKKAVSVFISGLCQAGNIPSNLQGLFRFIDDTAVSANEALGTPSANEPTLHIIVCVFFFLRFFCPALVSPDGFGVIQDVPSPRSRRHLILISKVLQSVANGGIMLTKEPYMGFLQDFVTVEAARVQQFFSTIISTSQMPTITPSPQSASARIFRFSSIHRNRTSLSGGTNNLVFAVNEHILKQKAKLECRLDVKDLPYFRRFCEHVRGYLADEEEQPEAPSAISEEKPTSFTLARDENWQKFYWQNEHRQLLIKYEKEVAKRKELHTKCKEMARKMELMAKQRSIMKQQIECMQNLLQSQNVTVDEVALSEIEEVDFTLDITDIPTEDLNDQTDFEDEMTESWVETEDDFVEDLEYLEKSLDSFRESTTSTSTSCSSSHTNLVSNKTL